MLHFRIRSFLTLCRSLTTEFFWKQVDQPLCLECTSKVREEIAATIAEVEAECVAYQAGLDDLEKELPLSTSLEASFPNQHIYPTRLLKCCLCEDTLGMLHN